MTKPWQTDNWFVSPFNFDEEARALTNPPKTVVFHDVTLRNGEQQLYKYKQEDLMRG